MKRKIVDIVQNLVQAGGTRDPVRLCQFMGIKLIFTELPVSTQGFYMNTSLGQAIVVNEALSPEAVPACIAHELGHACLHGELNSIFLLEKTELVVGRYEREADLFAATLLIDPQDPEMFAASTVEEIAQVVHLPVSVVEQWKQNCV